MHYKISIKYKVQGIFCFIIKDIKCIPQTYFLVMRCTHTQLKSFIKIDMISSFCLFKETINIVKSRYYAIFFICRPQYWCIIYELIA